MDAEVPDNTQPAVKMSPYDRWKIDPTEDNLLETVNSLTPTINHVLTSIGSSGDRQLKAKARALTAKAIKSYNPMMGAQLQTWTSRQLLPLRRAKRLTESAVHVPEGIQLDAMSLMKAEQSFIDENDREPDLVELADYSKIPLKRIQAIRKGFRPMPSEGAFANDQGDVNLPQQSTSDYGIEAMDYVYRDADYIDRKIMEMQTGYGGAEVLPPKVVAERLNLTPTQLSRRRAKLGLQVMEIEEALNTL